MGAAVNTVLFSTFMHSIRAAMADAPGGASTAFLTTRGAIDFSKVDLSDVVAKSRAEFWSIIRAGLKLWPVVSVVNFTLIKSIEGRNLVGGLAGVAWGIYMSLFTAR